MRSIVNARLLRGGRLLEGYTLTFDTHIRAVERGGASGEVIDAQGAIVSPGLIDMHMHGMAGSDVEDGADALRCIAQAQLIHGVTGFLASIGTADTAHIRQCLSAVSEVRTEKADTARAALLGAHLEGPFINPSVAGALDASHAALPSRGAYEALTQGHAPSVSMITIAPELPGAMELIAWCAAQGVIVALGHTAASPSCMAEAASCGAQQVTHLCNGMPPFHHREPGPVCGALITDALTTELIADGVHLAPETVRLALRVKDFERCVLVTDAMSATGLPDGMYTLGSATVKVTDGVARIPTGNLAGSTLTLDAAVRNLAAWGENPAHALAMASEIPARQLRRVDIGRIAVGTRADLVLWDDTLRPLCVWQGGIPL